MYRTTTQYLRDFTAEVMVTEHHRKGSQRWQPNRLKEELRETDEPFRDDAAVDYSVTVSGWLLRKDGSVGMMRVSRHYRDPGDSYGEHPITELPADIKAMLLGPDGLRDWKVGS